MNFFIKTNTKIKIHNFRSDVKALFTRKYVKILKLKQKTKQNTNFLIHDRNTAHVFVY